MQWAYVIIISMILFSAIVWFSLVRSEEPSNERDR